MPMEPIAIVGQACTLPEALTPAELWANVIGARDCLSRAPAGRWGVTRAAVVGLFNRDGEVAEAGVALN